MNSGIVKLVRHSYWDPALSYGEADWANKSCCSQYTGYLRQYDIFQCYRYIHLTDVKHYNLSGLWAFYWVCMSLTGEGGNFSPLDRFIKVNSQASVTCVIAIVYVTHPLLTLMAWTQSTQTDSSPGTGSYHCQLLSPRWVSALDHLPPPPPCGHVAS